jgi:hypothetical protein
MSKTRITLAVEEDARKLIERYDGKRAIGKLFVDLIRKHHSEVTFGPIMVNTRLDRIEQRLIKLLDRKEEEIVNQVYH